MNKNFQGTAAPRMLRAAQVAAFRRSNGLPRGRQATGERTMPPTEQARKNHDELFPGHVSALAGTDPELIEIFDNFAFDEVLRHGRLDARRRLMVQLAALIACQALREYRVILGAALTVGVTPVEAKEIVY
jgi:4-carboxymuconolactone decarboxylase